MLRAPPGLWRVSMVYVSSVSPGLFWAIRTTMESFRWRKLLMLVGLVLFITCFCSSNCCCIFFFLLFLFCCMCILFLALYFFNFCVVFFFNFIKSGSTIEIRAKEQKFKLLSCWSGKIVRENHAYNVWSGKCVSVCYDILKITASFNFNMIFLACDWGISWTSLLKFCTVWTCTVVALPSTAHSVLSARRKLHLNPLVNSIFCLEVGWYDWLCIYKVLAVAHWGSQSRAAHYFRQDFKAVSLLEFFVCASVVSYVAFVLSMFVPHFLFREGSALLLLHFLGSFIHILYVCVYCITVVNCCSVRMLLASYRLLFTMFIP